MKLEAKSRLTAMRAMPVQTWKKEVLKLHPKAQFAIEDGHGKTYLEKGDVAAHVGNDMQADIVGVYCYSTEVCWFTDLKGEFHEYETEGQPVQSNIGDPVSNGEAFDQLVDGDPDDHTPIVQRLMNTDGGTEPPDEQPLLNDDLPINP